jgi:hypothetical protein
VHIIILNSPLNGNYWWSGGIVGPIVGAICGVWVYFFFVEYHHPIEKCEEEIVANIETISRNKFDSKHKCDGQILRAQI